LDGLSGGDLIRVLACERCKPVKGKPVRGTSVRHKPVRGMSVRGTSVRGKSVRCMSVRGKPVRCKPVRGKPVRCKPVRRKPVRRKLVRRKPVRCMSVRRRPVGCKPLSYRGVYFTARVSHIKGLHTIRAYISQVVSLRFVYLIGVALSLACILTCVHLRGCHT
jgi:hypothetical protein